MKTDYDKIDQELCAIFGPQFVDSRITVNVRSKTYTFLQWALAYRTDSRYRTGLFHTLSAFDLITNTEYSRLMERFVKKKKKTPAR